MKLTNIDNDKLVCEWFMSDEAFMIVNPHTTHQYPESEMQYCNSCGLKIKVGGKYCDK